MIGPINASLIISLLRALFCLIISYRNARLEDDIDEEIFDRYLLPNHQLIMLYINLLVLVRRHIITVSNQKAKSLIKPHMLMRLLHGYRLAKK